MAALLKRVAPLLAVAALWAQDMPTFRSETTLALVNLHVVRHHGYVVDLKAEDFELLDDGVERAISLFERGDSARRSTTVDLRLIFDTSGSVTNKGLLDPLAFKSTLLDQLPEVRLTVYGFDLKLRRFCAPTRDVETLREAMAALKGQRASAATEIPIALPPNRKSDPNAGTWLYEAIAGVAADQPHNTTRLLMVFSDGLPSTTSTPEDAAAVCHEWGVPVYPVLLGHWAMVRRLEEHHRLDAPHKFSSPPSIGTVMLENQDQQARDFARLGELTGGRAFDPFLVDLRVVNSILLAMVSEVRTQYVIGFSPPADAAPRKHKIEVRLRDRRAGTITGGKRTLMY